MKRIVRQRHVSRKSSSCLAAFQAQSRLVSSLSRIHRSRHELRVLLNYLEQSKFLAFFGSKHISDSNGCFPLPMTYSDLIATDLVNLPKRPYTNDVANNIIDKGKGPILMMLLIIL